MPRRVRHEDPQPVPDVVAVKRILPLLLLLASCTTAEHFQSAIYSAEVGYYQGSAEMDFVHGSKDAAGDNYGFFVSIHPFAWHAVRAQAEAHARAITEAQYRAKMGLESDGSTAEIPK